MVHKCCHNPASIHLIKLLKAAKKSLISAVFSRRNRNVNTEKEACKTHNKIGKIVRKAIKEAGGTMPENLPTPKKSLKQLEKENKKSLKLKN